MPSNAYRRAIAEATAHHASSKTYSGNFLRPHKPFLTDLIERLEITSALDYGCGKGAQYEWIDPADGMKLEEVWGFDVVKFDPCWPPFATEPAGEFDLVICTCVLGSIPIKDLGWVLDKLHGHARKAVFILEKIGPVKKKVFSDPHLFPRGWNTINWLDAITPHLVPGVETHLAVRYLNAEGTWTGRFNLAEGRGRRDPAESGEI